MSESLQDDGKSSRRIPTLVHYCQRVLNVNIDSIAGLGHDMPHRLVKPILRGCSADTLLRLERETPHIIEDNEDIWKDLCFHSYPLATEQYELGERDVPLSWRDEYFILREAEARRLEEAGNRIRNQRLEAEELKKQRQVKFTDRVPPAKRSRTGWFGGPTPKTLFQKTRAEANKIRKSVYGPPMLPPMPSSKGYRSSFAAPSAQISLGISTPVVVTKITHRSQPSLSPTPSKSVHTPELRLKPVQSPPAASGSRLPSTSTQQELRSPPKPAPASSKKDPMAALFMPKHRAHSQLPNQVPSSHTLRS